MDEVLKLALTPPAARKTEAPRLDDPSRGTACVASRGQRDRMSNGRGQMSDI